MKSAWVERDAKAAVDHYGKAGIDADLALRVYSTRLLGRDPKLVLHGGGNTSVKTTARDLVGEEVAVLRVKGSGWDMGAIEPAGMPAVRLEPLRAVARARCAQRRRDGARAARLPARSAGALAVGRNAAARLHAGEIHRPHPRHRGAEPDRPAERGRAVRGGVWRAARLRALHHAGLRAGESSRRRVRQKSEGRRPDPRQARHLHLRRRRRAKPTSA